MPTPIRPDALSQLLAEIRACRLCEAQLPHGVRPVVQADARARILVVGQAPGRAVHLTGIPFNDPSGDRLRQWMGIDRDVFYDAARIAVVPMGFCFPGSTPAGDLPPRPECAPASRRAQSVTGAVSIAVGSSWNQSSGTDPFPGTHWFVVLADGTVTSGGSPFFGYSVDARKLTGVVALSAGEHTGAALRFGGTVRAWGLTVVGNRQSRTNRPSGVAFIHLIDNRCRNGAR